MDNIDATEYQKDKDMPIGIETFENATAFANDEGNENMTSIKPDGKQSTTDIDFETFKNDQAIINMSSIDSDGKQSNTDMHIDFEAFKNDEGIINTTSSNSYGKQPDTSELFKSSLEGNHKASKNKLNFPIKSNSEPKNVDTCQINEDEIKPSPSKISNVSLTDIINNAPCVEVNDDGLRSISSYRLKVLREEIATLVKQCALKEDEAKSLEKRLKDSEKKFLELKKSRLQVEKKYEKLLQSSEESKKRYDAILSELTDAKAQIVEFKALKKESNATRSDLEMRLNQALSKIDKLKAESEKLKQCTRKTHEKSEKQLEETKAENTLLSKQKTELFVVVTKQMKLINNLKRQILHLKAGILEKFTEDEVRKAIEYHIEK